MSDQQTLEQRVLAALDEWDEQYDPYYDPTEPYTCGRCGGEGEILVCIDDMCRGSGGCIHGDGYRTCPDCKGAGEIYP